LAKALSAKECSNSRFTRGIAGDRQFGRLLLEYLVRRQATAPAEGASATDEFLVGELLTILAGEPK
jgi:hypothetical protein